jgi:hypothetical protein
VAAAHGVSTGLATLVGLGPHAEVYLDLPGRSAVVARSVVPLGTHLIGRQVLVAQPDDAVVVLGVLLNAEELRPPCERPLTATLDGECIDLSAEKQITLRCGRASIALSAVGKIVIKGAKLLAAASGLHRIRGGAVQIN